MVVPCQALGHSYRSINSVSEGVKATTTWMKGMSAFGARLPRHETKATRAEDPSNNLFAWNRRTKSVEIRWFQSMCSFHPSGFWQSTNLQTLALKAGIGCSRSQTHKTCAGNPFDDSYSIKNEA
mmetsp:Transcript_26161/g.71772  ORF Transcript_26161/g.71772 Transcript_26161/m.71772 type:complete len:124 (+) Transcript_26161:702-1073(+)